MGLIGHRLSYVNYELKSMSANISKNIIKIVLFEDLTKPSQITCYNRCRASSGPPFWPPQTPRGPSELHPLPPRASEAAQGHPKASFWTPKASQPCLLGPRRLHKSTQRHHFEPPNRPNHEQKSSKRRPEGLAPTKIQSRTRTPIVLPKTSRSRKGAAVTLCVLQFN